MQLTPRYGDDPVLRLDLPIDPAAPMLRQRNRLASVLAELDDHEWSAPTRCEGWSVKDVIAHLVGTNQFWAVSIAAGLQGAPTRFLADFDPATSPPQMVDAIRSWTPAETLDRFVTTNQSVAEAVAGIDDASWSALGEAPPGHVELRLVLLHALWDSWIHERDVLLPLGLEAALESDEVAGCLTYAAAVGPALSACTGSPPRAALAVHATDPDVRFVVEIGAAVVVHDRPAPAGAARLSGDAVELVEALSFRAPFPQPLDDEVRALLGGLGEVFDVVG